MLPAATYEDVCAYITRMYYRASGQEIPPGQNKKVRMVGLLFARPDDTLAKVEVVPNLDYFHYRSGKHINFFCAGYDGYTGRDEAEGYRQVNEGSTLKWGRSGPSCPRLQRQLSGLRKRSSQNHQCSGRAPCVRG